MNTRYIGVPSIPFTVVDIPRDRSTIEKLIVALRKITGTRGCPHLLDRIFIDYCMSDREEYPHITIDSDNRMYRSRYTEPTQVSYLVVLRAVNQSKKGTNSIMNLQKPRAIRICNVPPHKVLDVLKLLDNLWGFRQHPNLTKEQFCIDYSREYPATPDIGYEIGEGYVYRYPTDILLCSAHREYQCDTFLLMAKSNNIPRKELTA